MEQIFRFFNLRISLQDDRQNIKRGLSIMSKKDRRPESVREVAGRRFLLLNRKKFMFPVCFDVVHKSLSTFAQ